MLHFNTVPCYITEDRISKTLLLHMGYLNDNKRQLKFRFYQIEDREKIIDYDDILVSQFLLGNITDISLDILNK